MVVLEKTLKISSKGQITLPKQAREMLKTEVVRLIVDEDVIRIEPIRELAGSLKPYADRFIAHEEAREKAWSEVIREKHLRD